MYETLMQTLRQFFGGETLRFALLIAIALIIVGLTAWASPAFREWFKTIHSRGGWRASLVSFASGVFKLLFVFVLARVIIVAMIYQAVLFEGQHGRVTETNRSAVLMKWGYPHEQRELSVTQTEKKVWVTRQLKVSAEKEEVKQESYWEDQEKPVQAIDGEMPTVISVSKETKELTVDQKSIYAAEVALTVKNNPRTLGGANYAGYEDSWSLKYVVANHYDKPTTAHMSFPLPARAGFYKFSLKVDGQDMLDKASSQAAPDSEAGNGTALGWTVPMPPGKEVVVEIKYDSRGLEHLRYIPAKMTQMNHYRVTATIEGIPPNHLDFPIGSMPPAEKLTEISSTPYTLHWNLDNALTDYDIGIKLPSPVQPNYYMGLLLNEAPVGLILLLLLLVVPRIIVGNLVHLTIIGLPAAGYYLLYTLTGTLATWLPNFAVTFAIAAIVLTVIIGGFRICDRRSEFLSWQDTVVFAALAILYPMVLVDMEDTQVWMQIGYVAILLYFCILVVKYRVVPAMKKTEAS
jgi:hypothetical protein